jgi:hypothetical protein
MTINKNIDNLIHESEQKKIEELFIPTGPIGLTILAVFLIFIFIRMLYRAFSKVHVPDHLQKYFRPFQDDFYEFIGILEQHTDQFTHVRSYYKGEDATTCGSISAVNKEYECLVGILYQMQLIKLDIILSTLYDDKVDLLDIKSLDTLYTAKYPTVTALNGLISSLQSSLAQLKTTVLQVSKESLNEFNVPIAFSYKDFELYLNRRIRQIAAQSTQWN